MKNYHILQIESVPATNTEPARVRIRSQRFRQSVLIYYSNEPGDSSPTYNTAIKHLESKGFDIVGKGEGGASYDYIITNTFEPLKPFKS